MPRAATTFSPGANSSNSFAGDVAGVSLRGQKLTSAALALDVSKGQGRCADPMPPACNAA